MGHNATKYILALLILATVTPQIAAQCPARKLVRRGLFGIRNTISFLH
jgi:hypothetical protein